MASYEDLKWQKGQANWHIQHNDLCERVGQDITNIETEIQNARGTKPTLDQRLDVSFNEDGTLKANIEAYQSEWIKPALTFTYVDSTNFKVEGSQTDIYAPYRRLKINHSTSGTSYTHVVSAGYDDVNNETTVTVADAVIQSDLVSVEHSIIHSDRTKDSLPRNIDADTVDSFHASQSPQANTIPVLNSSGQLALPFVQIPILVNGQDMMSRVFYVDAENGDDNNDGSESAPFATLQKAVNSVPNGGKGLIIINGDYMLDVDIPIFNKIIEINPRGTLQNSWYVTAAGGQTYCFKVFGGILNFYLDSSGNSKLLVPVNNTGHSTTGFTGLIRLEWNQCSVVNIFGMMREDNYTLIEVQEGALFKGDTGTNVYPPFCISIGLHYAGSNRNLVIYDNSYLVSMNAGTCIFTYLAEPGISIVNENGESKDIKDVISGIVKDANGVPRNILSNIIF